MIDTRFIRASAEACAGDGVGLRKADLLELLDEVDRSRAALAARAVGNDDDPAGIVGVSPTRAAA